MNKHLRGNSATERASPPYLLVFSVTLDKGKSSPASPAQKRWLQGQGHFGLLGEWPVSQGEALYQTKHNRRAWPEERRDEFSTTEHARRSASYTLPSVGSSLSFVPQRLFILAISEYTLLIDTKSNISTVTITFFQKKIKFYSIFSGSCIKANIWGLDIGGIWVSDT